MPHPDYLTKYGEPISFQVYEPDELRHTPKEPWLDIGFYAWIEGELVGYLITSYVPREKWYPTIWVWMRHHDGLYVNNPFDLDEIWEYLESHHSFTSYGEPVRPLPNREDRDKELQNYLEHRPRVVKRFEEDYQRQVDSPMVSFIRVYGPDDRRPWEVPASNPPYGPFLFEDAVFPEELEWLPMEFPRANWRRQYIALNLYEFAARWLALNKGMVLYAGGQLPEAKAAWDYMKNNGYPIREGYYMADGAKRIQLYLDYLDDPLGV